jgi:cobalt/nickel transport system permease protein
VHIPDGFLDVKTAATTGALAAAGLAVALRQANRHLPPRRVPLLGLAAAFVFAAQMLNFPIPGAGTSGHLIGGGLAAALLGPSAAVIAIAAVLIVQCFMFADGGITALGANIFNMAIIGGVGGWCIFGLVTKAIPGLFGRILAATFAAWCATVAASIVCAIELAASGTARWSIVFPAMATVHLLIGIGEAIITALVLTGVWTTRPDLMKPTNEDRSFAPLLAYGAIVAMGLAIFVSPFASQSPDGLDKTAETLSFAEKAAEPIAAPMADYAVSAITLPSASTSVAGAAGTVVVFVLAWILARALVPKSPPLATEVASPE